MNYRFTYLTKIVFISLLFLISVSLLFSQTHLYAQFEMFDLSKGLEEVKLTDETTINTLKTIIQSMETIQAKIQDKEYELLTIKIRDQKTSISNEITKLTGQLSSVQKDFEEIATGVDLAILTEEAKKHFNWQDEIQDILGPIIQEIRNITAHPREIEKLNTEIAYYQKWLPVYKSGLENIQKLIEKTGDRKLKERLTHLQTDWTNKNQQMSSQLSVAQYQLAEKLKGKKSFLESAQQVFKVFFKSRGRNLLLSILAFLIVWLFLHFLYQGFYKVIEKKWLSKRTFYTRLINVLYFILSFAGSMGALLFVLYITGDWVLLGLVLIFLIGLAWAARQTIPKFLWQIKLLLNLGPVKEDERLFYNGLPWKVESLNFSTQLVNHSLMGGMIRLPLADLVTLRSRPYHSDEPWFPCKEQDWVILSDGVFGKVIKQTPEVVELLLPGGSHKMYPTTSFLNQNPDNLSSNFRICVTFGIDYQHQKEVTTEVIEKLRTMMLEGLKEEGYENAIVGLNVEFSEASASSLDLMIIVDFSGDVAQDYFKLRRLIQKIAVESSNRYGWVIPFPQLTVHTENG